MFFVSWRRRARSECDGGGRRKSLLQPFITVRVSYKRFEDIEEGRKVWLIHAVQMSSVAFYCLLVAKYVVPVVAVFTTGTEGGDVVLRAVVSKTTRGGEVLLTQPTGGAVVIASVPFDKCLGFFGDPTVLS